MLFKAHVPLPDVAITINEERKRQFEEALERKKNGRQRRMRPEPAVLAARRRERVKVLANAKQRMNAMKPSVPVVQSIPSGSVAPFIPIKPQPAAFRANDPQAKPKLLYGGNLNTPAHLLAGVPNFDAPTVGSVVAVKKDDLNGLLNKLRDCQNHIGQLRQIIKASFECAP
jgi:hypothetical protein